MKRKILLLIAGLLLIIQPLAISAQHDYNIANGPGAVVRGDINDAFSAVATNNSAATAPATTFANMWWFDTSTNILKQRNNANTDWDNVAFKDGSGFVPYRQGTQLGDVATLTKDTDTALTANSDTKVATQKATKAYADGKISKTTAGEIAALTEKTSTAADDVFLIEDSAAGNAKKKLKVSSLSLTRFQEFLSDGTFTAPAGVTTVFVTNVGGGGAGGGVSSGVAGGGGGGGGAKLERVPYTVVPGNNYTVDVGAGGTGVASNNGNAGSPSTFDGAISAAGGSGGVKDSGAGGAGGAPSCNGSTSNGGTLCGFSGGTGATGNSSYGGGGGASAIGSGAAGKTGEGNGNAAAANSGGGGGGAYNSSSSNRTGGAGGSGRVLVEW